MNSSKKYTLLLIGILLLSSIPVKSELPSAMNYTYETYWYWCGSSTLVAQYNDGNVEIDYDIHEDFCEGEGLPFEDSFEVMYDNVYENVSDLIANEVDMSKINQWETERYPGPGACDGGGYNKILDLKMSNKEVTIEHIVDNDSCSGIRTNKSHSDILPQIEYIHNYTFSLIDERGTDEGFLSMPLIIPSLFALIITVYIFRKKSINY